MRPWEIEEIRRAVKGKWVVRAGAARKFNGRICTDSRKAKTDDLFIAIVGENHNAHKFVKDVIERGVAGVMVYEEPTAEVVELAKAKDAAIVRVDDTVAGLNRLAGAYRASGLRAKVIAVGGSNGKTTTKRIIHAILAEKFNGHASPKSFNNNIGMPLTLLEVEASHEYVVLEIGTNAPGEIAALGAVCRPDIAVITSIGLEHLEKLGDLAGVAREEAAIAEYLAEGGMLIVADVPELLKELALVKVQKIVVGMTNDEIRMTNQISILNDQMNRLTLTGVRETMEGTWFGVNGRGSFFVPLLGEHNAMNALMAIAVARRMGLSDEQIAAGLAKVKPVEMRLEPVRAGQFDVINDAYNANPSSVEASLRTFAKVRGGAGRRVVILGDMLELGAQSDVMHRGVGSLVAAWKFDLFVAVGRQMGLAADVAEAAGIDVKRFSDTSAARGGVGGLLKTGDQILLKGSRGMAMDTLLAVIGGAPRMASSHT